MPTSSEGSLLTTRQRWLGLFESLTVGIPFCVFKGVCGGYLVRSGTAAPLGYALLGLGALDLLLNAWNAVRLLLVKRRSWAVCMFESLFARRNPRRRELGLAVDTLVSFALVVLMIASGGLGRLGHPLLGIWNLAVIANVLGAGAMRVEAAFFSEA